MSWLYQLEVRTQQWIPATWLWTRWWRLYSWENFSFASVPLSQNHKEADREIVVRWGTESDTALLSQQGSRRWVEQRWGAGGQVCLATHQNRLVGVIWFQPNCYVDLDTAITIRLRSDQVWLYGSWVARDFRGRGLYRRLLCAAIDGLTTRQGIRQICLAVDQSNRRSRQVHEHLGARGIGNLRGFCIGSRWFGRLKWSPDCDLVASFPAAKWTPSAEIRLDLNQ